jgi:hypothetical protein
MASPAVSGPQRNPRTPSARRRPSWHGRLAGLWLLALSMPALQAKDCPNVVEPDLVSGRGLPYAESDKILQQARRVGVPATRIPLEDAGHTAFAALFSSPPDGETPVWDAVVAFFDRELGVQRAP